MLLGASQVATKKACVQLEKVRGRETGGTDPAKGKVERLVGKRTSGG
jgi:hypothetical protein